MYIYIYNFLHVFCKLYLSIISFVNHEVSLGGYMFHVVFIGHILTPSFRFASFQSISAVLSFILHDCSPPVSKPDIKISDDQNARCKWVNVDFTFAYLILHSIKGVTATVKLQYKRVEHQNCNTDVRNWTFSSLNVDIFQTSI